MYKKKCIYVIHYFSIIPPLITFHLHPGGNYFVPWLMQLWSDSNKPQLRNHQQFDLQHGHNGNTCVTTLSDFGRGISKSIMYCLKF